MILIQKMESYFLEFSKEIVKDLMIDVHIFDYHKFLLNLYKFRL